MGMAPGKRFGAYEISGQLGAGGMGEVTEPPMRRSARWSRRPECLHVLGLPMISAGIGHGSGAHARNEYMVIEPAEGSPIAGLAEVEKYYVDLLYAVAQ